MYHILHVCDVTPRTVRWTILAQISKKFRYNNVCKRMCFLIIVRLRIKVLLKEEMKAFFHSIIYVKLIN